MSFETIIPGSTQSRQTLLGWRNTPGRRDQRISISEFRKSLHIPLTTQLYFKDDPYIAEDPWASRKSSLAIGLKQDGELLHGVFDLVLARGF